MPLLTPPNELITLGLNIALALTASVGAGWWAHRLPLDRLERDGPVLRIRSWEYRGRFYERRLSIRSWKDRLPEAGAFFAGGVSKRHLVGLDRSGRARFASETRRAERAHWVALAVVIVLAPLWNRPLGVVLMFIYALAMNGPCLVVQRYNRARLEALERRSERASEAVG